MKITLASLAALMCCLTAFPAARLVVSNGNDDGMLVPPVSKSGGPVKLELNPRQLLGSNAIYISSMCALTSPNLTQSRMNLMAGMAGASVPTDRAINPAAWDRIPNSAGPNHGLQWFDLCVTATKSFLGTPAPTNSVTMDEHGSRVVISPQGQGSPNGYYVRVSISLTNIAPAYFPISTNSDGVTPLAFSYTFPGIFYGQNHIPESSWSAQLNKWVAGGDDTVYDGSQGTVYPHEVTVDFFQRFGSSLFITGNSISDFTDVMDQFATTPWVTLTTELITNGVTVASETVVAAIPSLSIRKLPSGELRLEIIGGQLSFPYEIETAADVQGAPWIKIPGQTLFSGSQGYFDTSANEQMRYFRLKARRTVVIPPPDT